MSDTVHCLYALTKTLSDGHNYPHFADEDLIGRRRVADGDRWMALNGPLSPQYLYPTLSEHAALPQKRVIKGHLEDEGRETQREQGASQADGRCGF